MEKTAERIMVVEDDADLLRLFQTVLKKEGYEVKFPEGLDLTVSGKSIQALPPADFNLFTGSTLMF